MIKACMGERVGFCRRGGGRGTRGIRSDITDFPDPVLDESCKVFTKGEVGPSTASVYGCGDGAC